MRRWLDELGPRAPDTVYVNLSSRELLDPTLPSAIASALTKHGLLPSHLGLEIVEEDVANSDIVEQLNDYRQAGHPLSLDDFGTGYSSLSRVLSLPITLAKIDKSFVEGIPADTRRTRLIDGVLRLAASLDIIVVGEGVENAAQARHLIGAGCQLLQGYHLAAPQPAAELSENLAQNRFAWPFDVLPPAEPS